MELRAELLAFLRESGVDLPEGFDDDTPLLSSGTLDSVALFNLVLWIEERAGRSIDPTEVDIVRAWDSVRRILRYVEGEPDECPGSARTPVRPTTFRHGIRIVPYTGEHKEAVARFQTGLWSRDVEVNRRYLEWKHERNPYAEGPRMHLAFDGDALVGLRSMYPARWRLGSPVREVDVLVADDLQVRDDHRDSGLVSAIMRAAFDDLRARGVEYVFSLAAQPVTIVAQLAMGWRSAGHMRRVGRSSTEHRVRTSVRERLRGLPWVWRYSHATADIERDPFVRFDTHLGAASPGEARVELSDTARVAEMAALVGRLHCDGRIRHVRDETYLRWRLAHPMNAYRFVYAGGDTLEGFLVLKWSRARVGVNPSVEVADLEATSPRVALALLETAIQRGRFPMLVTWRATHVPEVAAALDGLGFETVDRESATHGWPSVLVRCVDDARLQEDWTLHGVRLLDPSSWDVRMIYTMTG